MRTMTITCTSREMPVFFCLTLILLGYLFFGTGIHSDDYGNILTFQSWSTNDWSTLYKTHPTYLYFLPAICFDYVQFISYGYNSIYYDLAKIVISFFAIFAAWLFAKQYLEPRRALLFALLFVLYPLHDATNYWFTGTYMMITGAWVMLSHTLLNQGHTKSGMAVGFVGAFWSYASPPLFGGLSVTFLIQKEFRKFFLFILPEVFYVGYYFSVSRLFGTGGFRTNDMTSPLNVAKQFALQIGTFLDVAIGPSFWLKIYYSLLSLSWLSALVGAALAVFLWRLYPQRSEPVNKPLLLAFAAVTLCAFLIYALTGMYPQIAFNHGNRVTYFGSMLLALLVVSLPWRRGFAVIILAVISLSIVGLSDHWKAWNHTQTQAIETIRANRELLGFNGKTLFVSGYQFSHLGAMSHIEFFSVSNIVRDVFQHAMGKPTPYQALTLNKQQHWENGEVVDRKFGDRVRVGDTVAVYDAEKNQIRYFPAGELNAHIESLPTETRHWVQLLGDGPIRSAILYLMPRLKYAFS